MMDPGKHGVNMRLKDVSDFKEFKTLKAVDLLFKSLFTNRYLNIFRL